MHDLFTTLSCLTACWQEDESDFLPAYMSAGIMVLSMNILILRIGAASFFKTTFWKIDRLFLFRSWVEENRTDTTIIIRSKNDS